MQDHRGDGFRGACRGIDNQVCIALVEWRSLRKNVCKRLACSAGNSAQGRGRYPLLHGRQICFEIHHRAGSCKLAHDHLAIHHTAASGDYRPIEFNAQQHLFFQRAQVLVAVAVKYLLQRSPGLNLDIEIGVHKAQTTELCEHYTNRAFSGAGHSYQTDGSGWHNVAALPGMRACGAGR